MQRAKIYVDHTHCGRHVTGLERITQELFSQEALAPLAVDIVAAPSRARMMLRQTFSLPALAMRDRTAIFLTPGFPPSPALTLFGARVLPYIHDVFLLTRRADLNLRAKLYMAKPFAFAVARLPAFLVNSEHTRRALAAFCRADADIALYRPQVRDVFGLGAGGRAARPPSPGGLRLVAVGTVEPRKNLLAAAAMIAALRQRGQAQARLDIVGRIGWGDDAEKLRACEGVTLHGYQPAEATRALIEGADAFITTSHDEGLGLPLLEVQYAGLPVIAPDAPVFREVLGDSGWHVDPRDPGLAAQALEAWTAAPDWRARAAAQAAANLARWNAAAAADRHGVIARLARLAGAEAP